MERLTTVLLQETLAEHVRLSMKLYRAKDSKEERAVLLEEIERIILQFPDLGTVPIKQTSSDTTVLHFVVRYDFREAGPYKMVAAMLKNDPGIAKARKDDSMTAPQLLLASGSTVLEEEGRKNRTNLLALFVQVCPDVVGLASGPKKRNLLHDAASSRFVDVSLLKMMVKACPGAAEMKDGNGRLPWEQVSPRDPSFEVKMDILRPKNNAESTTDERKMPAKQTKRRKVDDSGDRKMPAKEMVIDASGAICIDYSPPKIKQEPNGNDPVSIAAGTENRASVAQVPPVAAVPLAAERVESTQQFGTAAAQMSPTHRNNTTAITATELAEARADLGFLEFEIEMQRKDVALFQGTEHHQAALADLAKFIVMKNDQSLKYFTLRKQHRQNPSTDA